jgi:hypothetical protein
MSLFGLMNPQRGEEHRVSSARAQVVDWFSDIQSEGRFQPMACRGLHRLPHNSSGEASSDVDSKGKLVNKRGPNLISSNAAGINEVEDEILGKSYERYARLCPLSLNR